MCLNIRIHKNNIKRKTNVIIVQNNTQNTQNKTRNFYEYKIEVIVKPKSIAIILS